MVRLTARRNGMTRMKSLDRDGLLLEPYEIGAHDVRLMMERLADYEDTGVEPHDLKAVIFTLSRAVVPCGECMYRNKRPTCAGRRPEWFCADGRRES